MAAVTVIRPRLISSDELAQIKTDIKALCGTGVSVRKYSAKCATGQFGIVPSKKQNRQLTPEQFAAILKYLEEKGYCLQPNAQRIAETDAGFYSLKQGLEYIYAV